MTLQNFNPSYSFLIAGALPERTRIERVGGEA